MFKQTYIIKENYFSNFNLEITSYVFTFKLVARKTLRMHKHNLYTL